MAISIENGVSASFSPDNSLSLRNNTHYSATQQKKYQPKSNLKHFFPTKGKDKSDYILALLTCFLVGGLGFHRLLMGGNIMLVFWYCITFGGFFMLLPFLDFIRMLIEPEHYQNNNKFFAAFGAM